MVDQSRPKLMDQEWFVLHLRVTNQPWLGYLFHQFLQQLLVVLELLRMHLLRLLQELILRQIVLGTWQRIQHSLELDSFRSMKRRRKHLRCYPYQLHRCTVFRYLVLMFGKKPLVNNRFELSLLQGLLRLRILHLVR